MAAAGVRPTLQEEHTFFESVHAMLSVVDVPIEIVQAILQRHLADRSAHLTDLEVEPIASDGYSGNHLFRAHLTWSSAAPGVMRRTATWVLKRWQQGGHCERLLGVDQPLEALGWKDGLLRPEALPAGVTTPIVGVWLYSAGRGAWIAMEDVAPALSRYSRDAPLHPTEAAAATRLVLDRLARLHTHWERPERQATLRRCPWLVPMERYLWCQAASVAAVLGRATPNGIAPGSALTDEFRADVEAFFAWLPSRDRAMFEELFCRRERIVRAMRAFPRTLIHGDIGDRNLGLRPSTSPAAPADELELVLIDWEWMGFGSPALDVARLWGGFPGVCDQSLPLPEIAFTDELPAYYFERYRGYGGMLLDARAWQRACSSALLGLCMSQVSFIGSMIRYDVSRIVSGLARQLDMITGIGRSLLAD